MNLLENYSPEIIEKSIKLLKFKVFIESLYRNDTPENNSKMDHLLEGVDTLIEAYVPSEMIQSYLAKPPKDITGFRPTEIVLSLEEANTKAKEMLSRDNRDRKSVV